MENKSRTKIFKAISLSLLLCLGWILYHTTTLSKDSYANCMSIYKKEISVPDKENAIRCLADRLYLSLAEVERVLQVSNDCRLVPLVASEEHKNCLIDIFSNSNKDYMKYYLDGKLRTPEQVIRVYYERALYNLWGTPKACSLQFIIEYRNKSVGRIGVGPIRDRGDVDCEIGYAIEQEFSGRGLTTKCVKAILDLMQYMIYAQPKEYDFNKLRATAKRENYPSNHILNKLGFKRSPDLVNDGYGQEYEYFYYFKRA